MLFIYGKPNCPYCTLALEYIQKLNLNHQYIDISQDEKALHFVKHEMNRKTVPFIVDSSLEGTSSIVGGYDDLLRKYKYHDPDELFD